MAACRGARGVHPGPGHPLIRALEHGGALGAFAAAGHALRHHRRAASLLVAIGLVTASALLVHIWDGVIEAHFHFFVMVVVLKGSASAIGARRLAEIAGRVDVAVKAGDVAEAIALRPALEEAVGLAVAALG